MTSAQLERIRADMANEDPEGDEVETPTKWWIIGLPEHTRPRAGFVENVDEVVDEAVHATR